MSHFSERIGSFNLHQMWENKEKQCCVNCHFYFQLHFISLQCSIKLKSEIKICLTNWQNTHVPQGFGPKLLCVLCAYAAQVLTTFYIIALLDITIVTFGSISDGDSIFEYCFLNLSADSESYYFIYSTQELRFFRNAISI